MIVWKFMEKRLVRCPSETSSSQDPQRYFLCRPLDCSKLSNVSGVVHTTGSNLVLLSAYHLWQGRESLGICNVLFSEKKEQNNQILEWVLAN